MRVHGILKKVGKAYKYYFTKFGRRVLFAIGEWDRTNVLAGVRNSNKYGCRWDNASRLDPAIDKARDLINRSCEHIEMAIHGIVHWYWDENGKLLGPEFYQRETEQNKLVMTPPDIVREHLDAYFEIYRRNGLSADIRSYIPPCFWHVISNKDDHISYILSQYGIQYISTLLGAKLKIRYLNCKRQ